MVLDTDTYNEIDDQFALVYALAAKEKIDLEAVYAAPFHNSRSASPGDGMEKSHQEILRVLERLAVPPEGLVFKGSERYLGSPDSPCDSPAVQDLISRGMSSRDPLYVVAIGAITNIASSLLLEPRLAERIVVVWLGGHSPYWPNQQEFNLRQDIPAARHVFDCGVPLVQIPCQNIAVQLAATVPELETYLGRTNAISNYLIDIFTAFNEEHGCISKVIWDISAVAYLIDPDLLASHPYPSPILHDDTTISIDHSRHPIRIAWRVNRDGVFRDLYRRIREIA